MLDPRQSRGTPGPEADDAAFAVAYLHQLRFTSNAFDVANPILRDVLTADGQTPSRVLVFVDDGVANAWPDLEDRIRMYARAHSDRMALVGSPQPLLPLSMKQTYRISISGMSTSREPEMSCMPAPPPKSNMSSMAVQLVFMGPL